VLRPLVFSRNRPAQLDLLLTSLETNGGPLLGPPTVLFRSDSDDFDRGYETCWKEHPAACFAEQQDDFAAQTTRLIRRGPWFVALTDDDVLYRPVDSFLTDPLRLLHDDKSILCFSVRLGLNTQSCYPLDRRQALPPAEALPHALRWDWRGEDGDFGYPASLDGHIFRTADLLVALEGRAWHNPNTLEDELVGGLLYSPRSRMASYFLSALVGVPLNRVAATHGGNRVASLPGCSPEELNARYLDGERLALETVSPWQVTGAHHEFAPVWTRPGKRGPKIPKKTAAVSGVTP
jgi:hypothetical protein